jgi:hypothetical protein
MGFGVWCAHNSGDEAELLQLNSTFAIFDSCSCSNRFVDFF